MEKTNHKNNIVITLLGIVLIIPFLSILDIKDTLQEETYQSWQSIAMVILAILLLVKSESVRMSWCVRLFGFYEAVILASGALHNGFSPGMAVTIAASVILFALLQTDFYYEMLSAICIVVVGALLINFPGMFPKLNDPNAEFFIGGKNYLGIFLIPGIFLLMLNSLERHARLTKPVLAAVVLALITIWLGASSTGIVVAICAAFFWNRSRKKKPSVKLYICVLLAVYALFLVFTEYFFNTELWLSFTELFGKESNLTSRTEIWRVAVKLVTQNPLFGVGRGATIEFVNNLDKLKEMTEAHNFILEILFEGGIVALLMYAVLFMKMINRLDMNKKKHRFVFVALFVILINGLTESVNNNFLVIAVLGVACRYATEEENERYRELREQQKKERVERPHYGLRRIHRG